jgi:ATP-binding cassette subfamily B protein/subfamily B ATP-binding cassette protein MsbA
MARTDPEKKADLLHRWRQCDATRESHRRSLAFYEALAPYVERYAPGDPFWTVAAVIGLLLVGTLLKSLFVVLHWLLVIRLGQLGALKLREQFFHRTLQFEVNHFNREGIADTMSRFTNDMTIVADGLTLLYGKMVREPLKMFACLLGAALISWQLLLVTLLLTPVAALVIDWLAKSLKHVVRKAMEEMAVMYGRLEETFRSMRVVKAFTMEDYERAKFHATNQAYFRKWLSIAKYQSLTNPLTETMGILMISIGILAGAHLALHGETTLFGIPMSSRPLDLGALLLFFALLAGAADPARKLSDIFTRFQSAAAACDRIYQMIDREIPMTSTEAPKPLSRHRKSIRFEEITFGYERRQPVLRGITLDVSFGETIAIVGPSGCGKSTLTSLIPRFMDPDQGRILIDGSPLPEVHLEDIRGQIGLVTQEPMLFNDTVAENIRYGSPEATESEIIEAARKANAHQFITAELEDGYRTKVGPWGGRLSGGQRQRIALARAILRDPAIFILDEATSQIDMSSEQLIHRALREFTGRRTTFIVTHRLGALDLADRIVVMREGEIENVGSHEQLLTCCPYYAQLYHLNRSA